MIVKARGLSAPQGDPAPTAFTDDSNIPLWSKWYVSKVAELGIISGYTVGAAREFRPLENASRAEACVMLTAFIAGTSYYVDAVNGHDNLDGNSIGTAWKTLDKVNGTTFQPGDHILFNRGQTWSGYLNPLGSGVAGSSIVIDAYGTGNRPKINMGDNWEGIMLYNQEYWEINNMEVYSDYWGEKNRYGIYIGAGTPNTTYHHFRISNCVVHDIGNGLSNNSNVAPGYAAIGVNFKTARNSSTAVSNLKVDDVVVDSCQAYNTRVGAGIWINGRDDTDDINAPMIVSFPFFSTNATIQNCIANDTKGIPIEITGFTGATIQNNVAFSPSLSGSECIMTVGVNDAVIQGNETYNNRWTGYADGGGIDADHFSTNVTLQYNYCHDNNGYGMTTLSWNDFDQKNVTMRYNILTNDNQGYGDTAASSYGEICTYASSDRYVTDNENKSHHFSARSFDGLYIYNNTIRYINSGTEVPGGLHYAAVNFNSYAQSAGATNFFKNNIIMSNRRFIYLQPKMASDNNLYYNIGDGTFASCWNYSGSDYNTLAAYATRSGQESHSKYQDPMLSNATYHSVGIPFSQFVPQIGSPVIDTGTEVGNMGTRDFTGISIPQNGKYDIGACEYVSGATPMPSPTPHPMPVTVPTRNMSAIVQNSSFEDDNASGVNRPLGWDVWNNFGNADACYTSSGSGGNTGSYYVSMQKATPYQIYLFQEITGIPDGRYTFTAYVQTGGKFNADGCIMCATKYGERVSQLSTPINTQSGSWTLYQIQNINVTNNQCSIGFWVDAQAGAWINLDDVTMTRVDDGTLNLSTNSGFETDGSATNKPTGWTASGANPEASYTQSGSTYMGNYKLVQSMTSNYTIFTSQTKNNIPNGNYNLYAYVSSGGGQSDCHMEASNYGGSMMKYDIPGTNGEWMPICVRNVHVTNNSITFGFYSNASANQWLNVDEVQLIPVTS